MLVFRVRWKDNKRYIRYRSVVLLRDLRKGDYLANTPKWDVLEACECT